MSVIRHTPEPSILTVDLPVVLPVSPSGPPRIWRGGDST